MAEYGRENQPDGENSGSRMRRFFFCAHVTVVLAWRRVYESALMFKRKLPP